MRNNKTKTKFLYLFLIPIALAFLFESFFKENSLKTYYNIIENILFAIALMCPLYFIKRIKWLKIYFIIVYLFFCFCTYFESAYYYLLNNYFSASAIFVILESNITEAKEFVSFYIDTPLLFYTLSFTLITFILVFKYEVIELFNIKRKKKNTIKIISVFVAILLFLKISTLIVFNLPYLIIKSNLEYYKESEILGIYKENKNGNFHDVTRLTNPNQDEELYVIIIGESTNRFHLGVYDYYRQTTPELNKIKDELLIYNNVISPHAYSVGALTKILTLGNYESPEKIAKGSIIQLINSVGIETYWLSNQRPIGPYESLITKISLSAKHQKFITTTIAGNSTVLDGELVKEFDKTIKQLKNKKNVIFLHLMGTHHHYENRYPESFNKFLDAPITNFKSKENFKKINYYDNTILYNDFLIADVINKVNKLNKKSFVLYFSDHGEEMFNDLDMAGHNEDVYSKNMFDVPFILWQSPKYLLDKNISFEANRKYMIDDIFHGIADLLDIKSKETEKTRSIFNVNFKNRKRIIKDTIDYDIFFKK